MNDLYHVGQQYTFPYWPTTKLTESIPQNAEVWKLTVIRVLKLFYILLLNKILTEMDMQPKSTHGPLQYPSAKLIMNIF
jgi:hypothetical protein